MPLRQPDADCRQSAATSRSHDQLPQQQRLPADEATLSQLLGAQVDAQTQLTWPKAAAAQQDTRLLGTLARLRCRLPNLRLCHGAAATACYVSSDIFSLDEEGAAELQELGLRCVVDLRWGHERQEDASSPAWRLLASATDWSPGVQLPAPGDTGTVYSIDFLRCPQSDLRRFLCDCPGHLHGSDIGAFAPAACGARPPAQLLADVADSFRTGVGAVLRLLSLPAARPALVVCPDGVCRSGVVACLLQLLACEEFSLVVEEMANAQLRFDRHRGIEAPAAAERRAVAAEATRRLRHTLLQRYSSVENYVIACGVSLDELRQLKTMPQVA